MMCVISLLLATLSVAKPLDVAYPVPGVSGLLPREDKVRIEIGNFLNDVFRRDAARFNRIGDGLKTAILNQVGSGAWTFSTKDRRLQFSQWRKIDLFIEGTWEEETHSIRIDFLKEGANESKSFVCDSNPVTEGGKGLYDACSWIVEKLIASCGIPAADAARMRAHLERRRPFFRLHYLAPGVVGHYTTSTVDARLTLIEERYRQLKRDPVFATRILDAVAALARDGRAMQAFTANQAKAIGLQALELVLGKVDRFDEDGIWAFVKAFPEESEKVLTGAIKKNGGATVDDLADSILDSESDEMPTVSEKKASPEEMKRIFDAATRYLAWTKPEKSGKAKADETLDIAKFVVGGDEHPLIVRRAIERAAAKGDVAFLESHLKDIFRQNRAWALTQLVKVDPERAYPHLLAALADGHVWTRLYAAKDLAKLAKSGDAGRIRDFLQAEQNRAVRLYLADALAKAEGKPLPPPRPAAHALPKDRTLCYFCGGRGALSDVSPWDAYYTCCTPEEARTPSMRRAYENGKIYFARLTPISNPGSILADPAAADAFWTTLDRQAPDDLLALQDGFVYGEETMTTDTKGLWPHAWRAFCAEAGLDAKAVAGDLEKLSPEDRVRWEDWGKRLVVEGFNVLYDFTHDYFGKLKPGVKVCTYLSCDLGTVGRHALDWKFDVAGGYIYGAGATRFPQGRGRAAYARIRYFRTTWPDRPVQWLNWGEGRDRELEAKLKGRRNVRDFQKIGSQELFFSRWDEPYGCNLASWLAGGPTGFFAGGCLTGREGGEACVWLDMEGVYPGYASPTLEAGIEFAFKDTLQDYQSMLKPVQKLTGDSMDEIEDPDALVLDEPGGKDDVAVKRRNEDIVKFRKSYLNRFRYTYDAARTFVGLPSFDPGPLDRLVVRGPGRNHESAAAQLMNGFDVVDDAEVPVRHGSLGRYRFVSVSSNNGRGMSMSEATRQAWLKWLKETPSVLWVEGWFGENARSSFDHPKGDLKTKWPWDPVAVTNTTETLHVWTDPAYKSIVIFEKPAKELGRDVVEAGGKIVRDFFAKNGVKMDFAVSPGVITARAGNLVACTLGGFADYKATLEGVEVLTGERNPRLAQDDENTFALVATGDYATDYVAIHDGVRVLAGNRFTKVENVPGGVRVTVSDGPFGAPTAQPAKDVEMKKSGNVYTFTRKR